MQHLAMVEWFPNNRISPPVAHLNFLRSPHQQIQDVLGSLASGMSEAELLQDFPQLCHDDVLTCLADAADRERCLITLSSSAA
jgi:hypothetical protein